MSAADQLAGLLASIGPTGTALAIAAVPVVAAVAVYVTRMGTQSKVDRLEGEISRLQTSKNEELAISNQKYVDLDERYQALLRRGVMIQSQIETLRSEIEEIADQLDASDYSILVPAPTSIPGDVPDQLVFLCASGPQAAKLQWVRVPISSSLSGQVYTSGQSTIASPPASGAAFATRTDKITDYKTNETLSVCLRYRSQRVGVAQFLNKRSGRFDSDDIGRANILCSTVAVRVSDFISDPRRLVEMGHAPRRNQIDVTVMFIDLSNFDKLFSVLDTSVITDLLNQYFQDLGSIAFKHGATIDQFMGDGALFVFNIDQSQNDHQKAAFAAAVEMRCAFQVLRQRWVTLGYAGTDSTFVRFGLSCGSVTRTELGHSQVRRVTVIGPAVNAAAYACDGGPRDRDTICVAQNFKETLEKTPGSQDQFIGTATASIFELC
jgi:class 3 adenylate cyclase